MKKYNYAICGLLIVALAYFTFSGCQTTNTGPSGSFDRPERAQIWIQTSPRGDGRWCASGFGHRGSSLQWYIVPRAACHIGEPKRSVSWYLAQEDYYGRSGAQLQLYCDVAGEALGPAIIRPTKRAT